MKYKALCFIVVSVGLILGAYNLSIGQGQAFKIIIDSPTNPSSSCVSSDVLELRGRVEGTPIGNTVFYIVPIIYTNKYWKQPHQKLTFAEGKARWSSSSRLGRPEDKGISGNISIFVVDEANLKKINEIYQNGGEPAPEEVFSWKDNALRDIKISRCL